MQTLVIVNLASTLYMVGLIWMVQVVHYPLMDRVPSERFTRFERDHQRRTTLIVGLPMILEVLTTVTLAVRPPHPDLTWMMWFGLGLLAVVWIVTWALSVPCHISIAKRFDPNVHARLVSTNWMRTVAWSVRGGLMCWVAAKIMQTQTEI